MKIDLSQRKAKTRRMIIDPDTKIDPDRRDRAKHPILHPIKKIFKSLKKN